jgi:hypothetical protein
MAAMRTGKLTISRGHEILARLERGVETDGPVSFQPAAAVTEIERLHLRLAAIERLARLVEQGILSHQEFREEKALVMGLTGEELLLTEVAPEVASSRPSLAGRLLHWRIVAALGVAGLTWLWMAEPEGSAALLASLLGPSA